jgi:hypothetical protein
MIVWLRVPAGDGVNVADEREQQAHIAYGRDAAEERAHEKLQPGQGADEPEYAQRPREAQHGREGGVGGQQADRHDDEIEDVPAFPEKEPWPAAV